MPPLVSALSRHWRRSLLFGVPVAGIAIASLAFFVSGANDPPPPAGAAEDTPTVSSTPTATVIPGTPTNTPTPTPVPYANILNGSIMSPADYEARKKLLPIAVMIGNTSDAYPQYSLDKADVVYEAFVESGITRLMAVFWSQEAEIVEPIRSARTPFVIWVSELGAMYGHAGSADTDNAANAGGQIVEWGIKDLNAFSPVSDSAYYRDGNRFAPHNLATATKRLRDAAAALGYTGTPSFEPYLFKNDYANTSSYPNVAGIEVNFSENRITYAMTRWHWDPVTNRYLRHANGGTAPDAISGKQVSFKTVIVQRAMPTTLDTGHVIYEQIGSGPAMVFMDGKMIEATWKKPDRTARTRYYDASGKEIALNRGPIFIQMVAPFSKVTTATTIAELPPIFFQDFTPPTGGGFVELDDDPPAFATPTPAKPGGSPSVTVSPSRTGTVSAGTPTATRTASPGGSATAVPSASPVASTSPSQAPASPTAAEPTQPPATRPPATSVPTQPASSATP